MSDNDSDRSRLFQLDGLRGLAVLLVVVSHIPYSTEIPEYAKGLTIYSYGNLAVRLFFVISGFIVTHLMLKEQQRAGEISLIRFYCRRFLRLAPVYYCYLGILALVALSGFYRDDLTSWLGSLVYLRNYLGSGRSATIHFWSLSVELQFYLIWPVLFRHFSLHRARRAFLVLGIIVIVAILVRVLIPSPDVGGGLIERFLGSRSILRYSDSLAVGCSGAYLYPFIADGCRLFPRGFGFLRAWPGFVSGVLLLILSFWIEVNQIGSMSGFMVALLPLFQAIIFVSLLLASLINSALSSLLAVRPLLWLGMVSYSLYVWHFLFLGHFMRHDSLSEAPLVYHWLLWMPTSIIVAWISYWLLERPFIRLRLKLRD